MSTNNSVTRYVVAGLLMNSGFPVKLQELKRFAEKEHVTDASFRAYISKVRKDLYPNEKIVATRGGYELQIAGEA